MKQENLDKLALRGKKLSRREKFMPIVALLVMILTAVFFLRPSAVKIFELSKQIDNQRQEQQLLDKKIAFLQQVQANLDTEVLDKQFLGVEEYLPSEKPSLPILINLSRLARYEGIQFSGLTLNPGKVKETASSKAPTSTASGELNNFDIAFTISGKKENILEFVSKIRELSPLMKVERFSLSVGNTEATEDPANTIPISASLNVKVYYQNVPLQKPELSSKMATLTQEETDFLQNMQKYLFLNDEFANAGEEIITESVGVTNPFAGDQ